MVENRSKMEEDKWWKIKSILCLHLVDNNTGYIRELEEAVETNSQPSSSLVAVHGWSKFVGARRIVHVRDCSFQHEAHRHREKCFGEWPCIQRAIIVLCFQPGGCKLNI